MSDPGSKCPFVSRRNFLAAAGGAVAVAGTGLAVGTATHLIGPPSAGDTRHDDAAESFWGAHQAGIVSRVQKHTYFAVFDLVADKRAQVTDLLRVWTEAAAKLTQGQPVAPVGKDGPSDVAPGDSGDALNLTPSRLTLTFGFGPSLFSKDGTDRYALQNARPAALVELPKFNGDEIPDNRNGGDFSIQACANDPQVAFHAIRQLARLADGVAQLRWTQTGFLPDTRSHETPRNLMGFKDGTETPLVNSKPKSPGLLEQVIWAGSEGPAWMVGGTYLVARRIRIALEHWDRTPLDFQEQVVGRHKYSGAPLSGKQEFDRLDLTANDPDGNPIIPENAHVRLATAASNDGAQILRRGYSYNDGTNFTAERWPPWKQGLEYDVGLLFMAYQKDPRSGFIKIFDRLSKFDMMNQYTTHTGSGVFACPPGAAKGEFIGQRLFSA